MVDNEDRNDDVDPDDSDTADSPASERETESRQEHPRTSPATRDQDIDDEDFNLPTG